MEQVRGNSRYVYIMSMRAPIVDSVLGHPPELYTARVGSAKCPITGSIWQRCTGHQR